MNCDIVPDLEVASYYCRLVQGVDRVEVIAPFGDHAQLVAASLALTRERIRLAMSARGGAVLEPDAAAALAEREKLIASRVEASRVAGIELPITWLSERLGLTSLELRLVWVLLAHERDATSRAMLREINTESCADPTTDTLRFVVCGTEASPDAARLLAGNSPLVLRALVERTDTEVSAPDHRKTWKICRRISALADGDVGLDADLHRIATIVPVDDTPIGIGGLGIETDADAFAALVTSLRASRAARTLVVQGQRGSGRRSMLRLAARTCGIELLEIEPSRISNDPNLARSQLRAIARDCRLFRRVPLIRDIDELVPRTAVGEDAPRTTASPERLEQLVYELDDLLVLATASSTVSGNRLPKPQIIEPSPLSSSQRVKLWSRALPAASIDEIDLIETMYPVTPSLIAAAATVARAQSNSAERVFDSQHVRIGLRAVLDGQLAGTTTRLRVPQSWDALVLPTDQRDALHELIDRVRMRRTVYETWDLASRFGRGLGVSALFSGPPGTGKTMAAGLIAKELATDVYQVDMSKIVSKWIGETEKNLARLFDSAECGHVILLFDEADGLFGKRTDVKTSNDRHANQQTNYLLQRLESYRGICILTTNNDTKIDDAFQRRLSFHVRFPMPDEEERVVLWRTMLRAPVPTVDKLDLDGLARRYEMSGGFIRNAVMRAAFYAAAAGTPVTNEHLARAAQLEYQAMGRLSAS